MDAPELALSAIGLIQGGLVYPCMLFAQRIAAKVAPKGAWLYIAIAMTIWALCMVAIAVVANQFVDTEVRRGPIMLWVVGLVLGLVLGGFLASRKAVRNGN